MMSGLARYSILGSIIVVGLIFISYFTLKSIEENKSITHSATFPMKLTSINFEDQKIIPSKYTCDGANINPTLQIADVPDGTESLMLIVDDPDATNGRTWDHWIMWNISPSTSVINENTVPAGAVQGTTSFGTQKYGGPCPPKGSKPHRYMFKLYALDVMLDISPSAKKSDVQSAAEGHIIGQALLTGLFNH